MSTPLPSPPRPPRPASVETAVDGGGAPAAPPSPVPLPPPPVTPRRRADAVTAYGNLVRARMVAFGGLAAIVAAVVYIVLSTGRATNPSLAPVAARVGAHHVRYWTVRPGQTLSSIAARESTSAVGLEHLNPHLIPGALISGQKVRLPG
jgi:LysM repeat protein